MNNQVNVDSLASRLAFVIVFWLVLLLLVLFALNTTPASASTMVQNNTFCNSITEKTKHTFKQEIFCDYARNVSNVTTSKPSFSSSGGGSIGGFGFYCKYDELFNATTERCNLEVATANISPYKEKPTKQYDAYDIIIALELVVISVLLIALAFKTTKELRGKE